MRRIHTALPSRHRRTTAGLASLTAMVAALSLHASDAHAQFLGGMGFSPTLSLESDALPHVEGTRMPGQWNWNATAAVRFLERPYTFTPVSSGVTQSLVHYQLWGNFLFQLGLLPNLSVGLDLPVLFFQNGDRGLSGEGTLNPVGIGDLRFTVRWSTRAGQAARPRPVRGSTPGASSGAGAPPPSSPGPFAQEGPGLSVLLSGSAPTGEARGLSGNGAWILHPSVVGDFRLFGLVLAGQLGYRARFDEYWPGQGEVCSGALGDRTPTVSCLVGVPLRDAITWSAGFRVPQSILAGVVAAYFEAYGWVDARRPFTYGTSPVELSLGVQRLFGEVTGTLAVSTGVTDAPGLPRIAGMVMISWAPRFLDEDGDGLRDNNGEDQCVGLPEDLDGYQDEDGCPEDNDNDEIPDADDRCPTVDEDVDGFEDDDGCPDPDNDRDGVPDEQDQCRDVAKGPTPDPARRGCPLEAASETPDSTPPDSPAPAAPPQ